MEDPFSTRPPPPAEDGKAEVKPMQEWLPKDIPPLDEDKIAGKLNEVVALTRQVDDDKEPFKSKYKARELLEEVRAALNQWKAADGGEFAEESLSDSIGFVDYRLGVNFIECEEPHFGEEKLMNAQTILDDETKHEKRYLELLDVWNHLAILWANRGEQEKALEFLSKAQSIYDKMSGVEVDEDNEGEANKRLVMERLYTMTCFYLAQVYGHLKKEDLSAKYCQLTLQRQLNDKDSLNALEWAQNAMQLAGYHLRLNCYAQSEHCLLAAEEVLPPLPPSDANLDEDDPFVVARAYLDLGWGKHWLDLLRHSRDVALLLQNGEDEVVKRIEEETRGDESLVFEQLGIPPVRQVNVAVDFDAARELFKRGLGAFSKAAKHFVLDGFVSDHVAIQQDISQLYKALQQFEPDLERRIKMHKRRVACFDEISGSLNPNAFADLHKQISFELGDIYSEILDLRLQQRDQKMCKVSDRKINDDCLKSIKYYQDFIKSFSPNGKLPEKWDPEWAHWFATGHFYLARMYTKIIASDRMHMVRNLKSSLEEYSYILDFVNKENLATFKEEQLYNICQEMVQLLPAKIASIAAQQDE